MGGHQDGVLLRFRKVPWTDAHDVVLEGVVENGSAVEKRALQVHPRPIGDLELVLQLHLGGGLEEFEEASVVLAGGGGDGGDGIGGVL